MSAVRKGDLGRHVSDVGALRGVRTARAALVDENGTESVGQYCSR